MASTGMASPRLDAETGVPLYQQLFVLLRDQIHSGDLVPGARVMSENALCETFAVSRITAQRALNELAKAGLVQRERGRGTIVRSGARPDPMRTTLDGLLETVGHIGRTTEVRVLSFGYEAATAEVAERLDLRPGARVLHARRVRHLGAQNMSCLATWVPEDIGALIESEDMSSTPLLLLLERAGVPVASAQQTVSATLADAAAAVALGVPAGSALIDVRRVVRDAADRPVEFIRILYRPELYQFEMTMRRVDGRRGRSWQPGAVPAPESR